MKEEEKKDNNWSPVYDIHKVVAGTALLFRYGTGPKEKVEIAFVMDVGDGDIKVVARQDGWAHSLKSFTNSGTLMNASGGVLGRVFRQQVLTVPEEFIHTPN